MKLDIDNFSSRHCLSFYDHPPCGIATEIVFKLSSLMGKHHSIEISWHFLVVCRRWKPKIKKMKFTITLTILPPISTICSTTIQWWFLGGVVVSVSDSWSRGHVFNSRPQHCRAATFGKLFTPVCICSPSSIIWYLARAFMSTRLYVAAIHVSNEQGEYCSSDSAAILIA